MIRVAVSGATGRMGGMSAAAVAQAPDLDLVVCYAPRPTADTVCGAPVTSQPEEVEAEVVVEMTLPNVVMENLERWHDLGMSVVVGTSGFTQERLAALREMWVNQQSRCIVVPNFSIGAVLMMRLATQAAPYYQGAEIVELHDHGKVDHPSGTALATARSIGAVMNPLPIDHNRGVVVAGIPVHSVRLPGMVAHQEVILGGPGDTLTIRHDTTDYGAFMPGVLLAVRGVKTLENQLTIGLDSLLGLDD